MPLRKHVPGAQIRDLTLVPRRHLVSQPRPVSSCLDKVLTAEGPKLESCMCLGLSLAPSIYSSSSAAPGLPWPWHLCSSLAESWIHPFIPWLLGSFPRWLPPTVLMRRRHISFAVWHGWRVRQAIRGPLVVHEVRDAF